MLAYILRRLLLGILLINFIIVQAAPGGPVEQAIAKAKGLDTRGNPVSGGNAGDMATGGNSSGKESPYRGAQGLDPELIKDLERQYGFDKPPVERFRLMLLSYLSFDFGQSFYRDKSVIGLIAEKMPVSISLGLAGLPDFYSAGYPQGHPSWQPLRYRHQHPDHCRLRHPRFSLCHPPDRAICRRQLLAMVPDAGAGVRRF